MAVTYTRATEVALLDPAELSERLQEVLREAMPWLVALSEEQASAPEKPGKWSAKQGVGHLIDSAVNHLGRIVRMQIETGLGFTGYEQTDWVRLAHYGERAWPDVLGLWSALNGHLVWMIGRVEKRSLANAGVVEGDPMTLGFLIEDYIAHMEYHLRAMRSWLAEGRVCEARAGV